MAGSRITCRKIMWLGGSRKVHGGVGDTRREDLQASHLTGQLNSSAIHLDVDCATLGRHQGHAAADPLRLVDQSLHKSF